MDVKEIMRYMDPAFDVCSEGCDRAIDLMSDTGPDSI